MRERNFAAEAGYHVVYTEAGVGQLLSAAPGPSCLDDRDGFTFTQEELLSNHRKTDLDMARDDLMSHIHRCGVLKAAPEHQEEWLKDTIQYLGECYPALSPAELNELKAIGERFCAPVIPHGKGHTALTMPQETADESGSDVEEETENPELAGV
jgi:hypothetical protein